MTLLLGIFFGLVTLLAISLQKTYQHVPIRELKRQARRGDVVSAALYRAAAYGLSLDLMLWLVVGVSVAGFVVVINRSISAWVAFLVVAGLLWFGFAWLPRARVGKLSLWLARRLAPALSWLLNRLHPILGLVTDFIHRHRPVTLHTGLYEKDDLLQLLNHQKVAAHNRIEQTELDIATHALTFGDHIIRDVMTPRRMVRFVKSTEPVGPVLMGELHQSGFSRFPVTGNKPSDIVGTFYLHDLVDNPLASGVSSTVKNVMSKRVFYVQEEQDLWHAFNAFLKTKHHLFLVVNNFEEIVGLITIEDVLEQILGKSIVDEFDQYDNLRAVAARDARVEHKLHEAQEEAEGEESTTEESTEVVE